MLPINNPHKPVLRHTRPAFTIEDKLSDWYQCYKIVLNDVKYGYNPQLDTNSLNRIGYRIYLRLLDDKLSIHKKTVKSLDESLCEIKHRKPYQLIKLCNCKFRRAATIIKKY